MNNEIPVYLFTGFLEAGKTRFIKETLCDKQFSSGEKTLLIACEDGEEQYDDLPSWVKKDLEVVYCLEEEDFTEDYLEQLEFQHQPDRVIIEHNGMWSMNNTYQALPNNWLIAQQIILIDYRTYVAYNNMFRNLMVEKLAGAEFVLFNRVAEDADKTILHQMVRAVNRRIQIAYEFEDGTGEYDDTLDPLPFDLEADVIEVKLEDYALWMQDIVEEPLKYKGKKVHLIGNARSNARIKKGFSFGREVMTCCVADIKFMGFVSYNATGKDIDLPGWYEVEAEVVYDFLDVFGKKAPSLKVYKFEKVDEPENVVATFY